MITLPWNTERNMAKCRYLPSPTSSNRFQKDFSMLHLHLVLSALEACDNDILSMALAFSNMKSCRELTRQSLRFWVSWKANIWKLKNSSIAFLRFQQQEHLIVERQWVFYATLWTLTHINPHANNHVWGRLKTNKSPSTNWLIKWEKYKLY